MKRYYQPCCYVIFSHFRENIHIIMKFSINLIFFRTKDYPHNRYILPYHSKYLYDPDQNYVEPDISVICDKDKLNEKGCNGAPDWIIEIVSPSTSRIDYGVKLFKYRTAGVREYWIVNPMKKTVTIFDLENEEKSNQYDFDETISSCIYEDLEINITNLLL